MRMPRVVVPTGGSSEMASCISIAASAASSALLNADITSSPMVLMTRPLAACVFCFIKLTQLSTAACATAFPADS